MSDTKKPNQDESEKPAEGTTDPSPSAPLTLKQRLLKLAETSNGRFRVRTDPLVRLQIGGFRQRPKEEEK